MRKPRPGNDSGVGLLYALKCLNPLKSRFFGNEKGSILFYQNMLPYLVEMARVELASEKSS